MQSSNPVFRRSEGFNGRQSSTTSGMSYPAYGTPTQTTTGGPGLPPTYVDRGPMTIDSVVQKTGITMAVVVVVAALTWVLSPAVVDNSGIATADANKVMGLWIGGAFV